MEYVYASDDIELRDGGKADVMAFRLLGPMVMVTVNDDSFDFDPDDARRLAAELMKAADAAEGIVS